mmetsp:Transcript_71087/g.123294  ORF Transcript_71087/g.123294 Transcript_71087/m.123294 type:complete len:295 (-) Transcript_71087:88-972(-)
MVSTQELVEELIERFPDDQEDLNDALEILKKQRLTSCERLAKLNDSQWGRLGVPMGIETILRDAVEAVQRGAAVLAEEAEAPAPVPEPLPSAPPPHLQRPRARQSGLDDDGELPLEPFEPEGLRRRAGQGSSEPRPGASRNWSSDSGGGYEGPSQQKSGSGERKGLLSAMDLTPPPDLELLWQQLLEDTLPPDKRAALQDSWEQTGSDHDKYMMFLEYSSYLRKPEITEEEKEERRKQLEPLMKEFGLRSDMEEESAWQGAFVWCVLVAVILFVAGVVYYSYAQPEALHDSTAL